MMKLVGRRMIGQHKSAEGSSQTGQPVSVSLCFKSNPYVQSSQRFRRIRYQLPILYSTAGSQLTGISGCHHVIELICFESVVSSLKTGGQDSKFKSMLRPQCYLEEKSKVASRKDSWDWRIPFRYTSPRIYVTSSLCEET